MAHYLVTANPKPDRLADLEARLAREDFRSLRPFGQALTLSLQGARIRDDGRAIWEEEDYCSPPLREERAAVLDEYFDGIAVETVTRGDGWRRIAELPRLFPGLVHHTP
jgi:hypothetical protein